MTHPLRWALPVALLGTLSIASSALAGGFGAPVSLRSTTVRLTAGDAAGNGGSLVVGWQEDQPAGKATFMRWSTDRGATFAPRYRTNTSPSREIQVDVCDGWAWAVTGVHTPSSPAGEWLVGLYGHQLTGGFYESGVVTLSGVARKPDVACAGSRRLAVAWFQKVGGSWHVKLFTRVAARTTDDPPERRFDLGAGDVNSGLAVTATAKRIVVSWFAGHRLKVKRFSLGAGAAVPVSPLATQDLGHLPYAAMPELDANGAQVVLAYTNRADLVVRQSTDGGVSFGGQRRLLDEPFPSEVGAFPTGVDVRGPEVLVEAAEIGGVQTFFETGYGFLSLNGGISWSQVSTHDGGLQVGALYVASGITRVAEAWDESVDDPPTQHLWFHRGL